MKYIIAEKLVLWLQHGGGGFFVNATLVLISAEMSSNLTLIHSLKKKY